MIGPFTPFPRWRVYCDFEPRRWAIEFSMWFPPHLQTEITLHVLCFWVSLVRTPDFTERSQSND